MTRFHQMRTKDGHATLLEQNGAQSDARLLRVSVLERDAQLAIMGF